MFPDMVLRTIRAPESKQATTLLVAVRCRPIPKNEKEDSACRDILRVVDDKVVVVLDPDVSKEYLDRVQNRSKERRYAFDIAFGAESTNLDVYRVTVGSMVEGVVRGLNATVFAYGATGSGKTHTMAGTPEDPGLMVLSLQTIFNLIVKQETEYEFDVTCSYLEVYNEVIYDLLEPKSGHLELREDPDQGITVAGLKRIEVRSAERILELLHQGNSRRKTESTDANATSSRSHAVLEIIVKRKQRNQYRAQVLRGKLALVDLAGSERASETNNAGQKLRDGANINKSLLALANCINALGKQQKKGLAYVPYRNSKLTRLLKDGLSGNSRTVMVATVSSGDDQYHQTINTLKYADRAKEIKTHIQTNVGTVDAHVADYQRMIDNLQVEVTQLRRELADKESQLTAKEKSSSEARADDELSWLDVLSHDINENVEERINLQKALFELEDTNVHNRAELQQLDDSIAEAQSLGEEVDKVALEERRQVVLDNIRDNDEAGVHYREDIEQNEAQRKELQRMIDDAISSDRNKTFLRILSQYRLLGMTNMELQFQMAVRDQIIQDQREAVSNLWLVLECSGLNRRQILKIAAQQGIVIEEGAMPARGVGSPSSIPTLFRQQSLTPAGPRHSFPLSPDVGLSRESSRGWTDLSSRGDESDTVMHSNSPRTPSRDWRNIRSAENGSNLPMWNNTTHRVPTGRNKLFQNSRTSDGVPSSLDANVHYSGWHSSYTLKGVETQRSLESRDRFSHAVGPTSRTGQDQSNSSCLPEGPRGRSPRLGGAVQETNATPVVRQRRRPRSSESQLRQSKWGSERGNGREKEMTIVDDDRSDDSGVDEDSSGNRNGWTASRPRDNSAALDNDMLRKELSRLDTELQDLKRGMDVNSAMQWNSNTISRTPYLASEGETPPPTQHRRRSSFGGVIKPVLAHQNGTPPTHSSFANSDAPHGGKGESNGHLYPASYGGGVGPSLTWDSRDSRGWSRAAALDSGLFWPSSTSPEPKAGSRGPFGSRTRSAARGPLGYDS